jgi:sugar transferase EpsL
MNGRSTFYRRTGKRLLDLALVLGALPFALPLMAVLALLVRRKLGAPVLFRQERPGRHGALFTLFKFRTMQDIRDEHGALLPDHQRTSALGRFLRRASLDELPELYNILRGEMSLVGPRPLLVRYLPFYSWEERQRFDVLPGLTGWAQVHGRNNLPWTERLALDTWYAQNMSLALDLRVLWLTLARVLKGADVQVTPHLAMRDLDEERRQPLSPG